MFKSTKMNFMSLSKLTSTILFLFCLLFITSCAITEEIWFEKNGSGRFEMNMDMSSMMTIMAMMDTTGNGLGEEEMDSTINFADAIIEDGIDVSGIENAELLDKLTMDLKMSEISQEMVIQMNIDFDHLDDIQKTIEVFEQVKALRDSTSTTASNPLEKATSYFGQGGLGFQFEKGILTRESQDIEDTMGDDEEMSPEDISEMSAMFGEMKYSTIIHLPGKVKSISIDDGIRVDDKTIRFDYDIMKLMKMKEMPGYTIKFKKK